MHLIGICSVVLFVIVFNTCSATPLDDYVNTPDPMFSWKRLQSHPLQTHTVYVLNMTSQKWFDESFSSQPIWWHYLTITVPRVIRRPKTAFLYIGGGANTDGPPTTNPMTTIAVSTGSITATVGQIPNQRFRFLADPLNKNREEDELIAWTWKHFIDINGTDPKVLLRFPMTKAVVRAMDAIQQFLQQEHIVVPPEFVIGGFSKRGWTTWTTAAVDNVRVVGAVPMVMDMLNLRPKHDVTLSTYFDRYHKTKILQIQGAGDEFFLPDSEDFFWDDLQIATGGSYLRRIPNTGHNVAGYEESLTSFFLSVTDRILLPSLKWTRTINETHGIIHAVIDFSAGKPKATIVTAYQARTSDTLRRDFRQAKLNLATGQVMANPVVWANTAVKLEGQSDTTASYSLTIPIPLDGHWIAAFIQVAFPGREDKTLTLTTETLILPTLMQ